MSRYLFIDSESFHGVSYCRLIQFDYNDLEKVHPTTSIKFIDNDINTV